MRFVSGVYNHMNLIAPDTLVYASRIAFSSQVLIDFTGDADLHSALLPVSVQYPGGRHKSPSLQGVEYFMCKGVG